MPPAVRVRVRWEGARLELSGRMKGRRLLRSEGEAQGGDLTATKSAGLAESIPAGTLIKGQEFFLVLVSIEEAEALLVVQNDARDLRQEAVEKTLPGLADEFTFIDLSEEDLDEGVGEFDEDDAVDCVFHASRPPIPRDRGHRIHGMMAGVTLG
jgi:hypothetical protein